jgi:4-hydroxy-4-methyl-2-oxoglutarate aldolase
VIETHDPISTFANIKRRLDQGQTFYDIAGMKALFDAAGLVEIDGVWSDRRS